MQTQTRTEFLPCQRAETEELNHQVRIIFCNEFLTRLLDAMSGLCMVLNWQRQIVFLNKALADFAVRRGADLAVGRRPGELLDCATAQTAPGGCGTGRDCRRCGVGQVLAAALNGRESQSELRLRSRVAGEDLELMVRASPLRLEGEDFIIVSAVDVGGLRRRQALERIFFHDILNTAGGIQGWAQEMTVSDPVLAAREYAPIVCSGAERLISEIRAQQELTAAERGELPVSPRPLSSSELVSSVMSLYRGHECAEGKTLEPGQDHEAIAFTGDATLLSRCLGNLIKNALEATPASGTVQVWSRREDDRVVFRVHNAGAIPPSAQSQVFHRSFSTKGAGRGLGTYSVRLLAERYLQGCVSFTSAPNTGTVFEASFPLVLQRDANSAPAGLRTSNQTSS